jgi:hypothetical protein
VPAGEPTWRTVRTVGSLCFLCATYASYLDSAKSFAAIYGDDVRGIQNAGEFLTALKNAGFNDNPDFTDTGVIDMVKRRMPCR